jgi:hypothetical protein
MLLTFFDISNVVHFEFVPQGQTVNQAYYVEILKQLHEAVYRKGLNFGPLIGWILHHVNAPAHKMLSLKQFLAQKSITEMEHPPCSPDLALYDFLLFKKN